MGKSLSYLVFVVAGVLAVGHSAQSSAEPHSIDEQTALYASMERTIYAAKDGERWEIYDENGRVVGTVKRTAQGNFKFYDTGGKFGGLILRSGIWLPAPSERRIRIAPGGARLYLDALRTIETIK